MPDIESIVAAAKAVWVTRIFKKENLSFNFKNNYLKYYGLNANVIKSSNLIMKMKFLNSVSQGFIKRYLFHTTNYNSANPSKYFEIKYFKIKNKCLLLKNWSTSGFKYIKKLFNIKGSLLCTEEILAKLRILEKKQNWIVEYKTVTNILKIYINKHRFDGKICKYVNIKYTRRLMIEDGNGITSLIMSSQNSFKTVGE